MKGEGPAKALWLFFALLFCWPFLGLADGATSFFGIPSLLFFLFLGWGILVAVLAAVSRKLGE